MGVLSWSVAGVITPAGLAEAAEELRDVKPPLDPPFEFWPLVISLAVILGVVLTVVAVRWFRRHREALRAAVPLPPPWEVAYRRLEELHAQNLIGRSEVRRFYTELSDIVRRYIEARFDIHAPEMTTDEFLLSLQERPELNAGQKDSLREFLVCCDMVKFARYGSSAAEMGASFASARRFVDETKDAGAAALPGLSSPGGIPAQSTQE